jgi:hypothetical protein
VNEIKSEETEQVNSRTVECKSNEASEEPPFHDTSTSMVHLFHQREVSWSIDLFFNLINNTIFRLYKS